MGELRFEVELVRRLLEEQAPDLAALELREVAGGWDNQMWRLGDDLAVRLPRTPRAPSLLRTEQRWLPVFAERLPLPVPVSVRVGEPSATFAHTWSVVRWVAGEPADRSPITRDDSADALAGFLAALHAPAPTDAPTNPVRGVPLAGLEDEFLGCLGLLDDDALIRSAVDTWRAASAAEQRVGPAPWIHGDLHPANVVVRDGALAGVIDFGEMCGGDPATDLSAAWMLLPDGAADRFFDAYGVADEATIARARGWAVLRSLHMLAIGRNGRLGLPGGKPTWEPAGHAALRRATSRRA